jgi:hypothetical protein
MLSFIRKYIQISRPMMGRWALVYDQPVVDRKIDLANEDHSYSTTQNEQPNIEEIMGCMLEFPDPTLLHPHSKL